VPRFDRLWPNSAVAVTGPPRQLSGAKLPSIAFGASDLLSDDLQGESAGRSLLPITPILGSNRRLAIRRCRGEAVTVDEGVRRTER
jgi:hypothetical protein